MRDPRLDFFRGIAMFIILLAHTPGNTWTRWIPARWGFSDATEIFVFCSGMASAIAFGKLFANRGMAMGTVRIGHRVWQVYWAHIGLFFFVAMSMAAVNATGMFTERDYVGQLNLYPFFKNTEANLIGLLTLTYVPNYFDILPMYLVILAMIPIVMGLAQVHKGLVALFVIGLWAAANLQVIAWAGGPEIQELELPAQLWFAEGQNTRPWFFNPFGWQLVFFTGFAFMLGWLPAPPVKWWLIAVALVIVLWMVAYSNIGVRELGFSCRREEALICAREWRIENRDLINKTNFGVLRYVHFLAIGYLAWVAVGPRGVLLSMGVW
ncbi:MAG: OpgC domain-containing protein, partial [Pseudomonadota bacterium]